MSTPLYSKQNIVLTPKQDKSATLTMDWFAQHAHYPPRAGNRVIPLINGEQAFAEVHDAIQRATRSVDIISWGFDPAMHFKPKADRIGELLDLRGRNRVKVRVLIWKNAIANFLENTIIGDGLFGSGGTALGSGMSRGSSASGEHQQTREQLVLRRNVNRNELALLRAGHVPYYDTPAKRQRREQELLEELSKVEAELNAMGGYNTTGGSGGTKLSPDDQTFTRDWFRRVQRGQMPNVEFRTRDFAIENQASILPGASRQGERGRLDMLYRLMQGDGTDTQLLHMLVLVFFASHHQKMVLVDYEEPGAAIGFVMGHNMHRNYWDSSAHLYDDKAAGRSPGFGPWQDLSMKVNGPLLHDLNHNFCTAWDRETPWYKQWFSGSLSSQRQAIKPGYFETPGSSLAQICRTQPQEGAETSILEIYRKAIGNVRNYAYFENQYFRYPEFAQQLRTLASQYQARGRKQDLYLFVVTNNPNSGHFSSTTYAMLQELGQEQLMPQAQRTLTEQMLTRRSRLAYLEANLHNDPYVRRTQLNEIAQLKREIAQLEAQGVTPDVEARLGGMTPKDIPALASKSAEDDNAPKPYTLRELPGLKVVIATLTACTPEPGQTLPAGKQAYFRDIYVHSKLLVVDDVFCLLSSANINTRSMHTDSELGLATPDPELARQWREKLWGLHLKQKSINNEKGQCDAAENFDLWNQVMDDNWEKQNKNKPLIAHLTRFWDVETPYATAVD
ncbi:phospholipase D-like domain-containing protein [Metapseudomonas otitidis]|uniref:phospholipase D-like domain-containing protein n=1 Tax=Metapseudomonas otitidis TaxID=319939 RepID=UPI001F4761A9|nr:phospholipase D-like domain-containing protein [Pseudomonas otitidis]